MTDPDVRLAIDNSARVLREVVWPVISERIGGGRLISVETVTSAGFAREIDTLAGVDAWQVIDGRGMRGLASRVQAGPAALNEDGEPWNTFSVRYRLPSGRPTEYHKRRAEIEGARLGWLRPHLTCQAYVTDWLSPQMLAAAVAMTEDIILAIDDEAPGVTSKFVKDKRGRIEIKIVPWWSLRRRGARIRSEPPWAAGPSESGS